MKEGHRIITSRGLSSSLKFEHFADFFGSRHCTCAYSSVLKEEGGNISVDLSLFVSL